MIKKTKVKVLSMSLDFFDVPETYWQESVEVMFEVCESDEVLQFTLGFDYSKMFNIFWDYDVPFEIHHDEKNIIGFYYQEFEQG